MGVNIYFENDPKSNIKQKFISLYQSYDLEADHDSGLDQILILWRIESLTQP